jgi:hypothetical protein
MRCRRGAKPVSGAPMDRISLPGRGNLRETQIRCQSKEASEEVSTRHKRELVPHLFPPTPFPARGAPRPQSGGWIHFSDLKSTVTWGLRTGHIRVAIAEMPESESPSLRNLADSDGVRRGDDNGVPRRQVRRSRHDDDLRSLPSPGIAAGVAAVRARYAHCSPSFLSRE